jgi:hypothetical protein
LKYEVKEYNKALNLVNTNNKLLGTLNEFYSVLEQISEDKVIRHFQARLDSGDVTKSISRSITSLIKSHLKDSGWIEDLSIFKSANIPVNSWKIDYYKNNISVCFGINHASGIAWNLIRPTVAIEDSVIQKNVITELALVLTVKESLRKEGGMDSAIATFEKTNDYMVILDGIIDAPLIIVGLEGLEEYSITHQKDSLGRKTGKIIDYKEKSDVK